MTSAYMDAANEDLCDWSPQSLQVVGEIMTSFVDWLWRRWGQMLCFGLGAALAVGGATTTTESVAAAIAGAAFLLTGAGLRATTFWQEAHHAT